MKLSRTAIRELEYLLNGGSSVGTFAAMELARKGIVTRDRYQFSNSPYSGIAVTLTDEDAAKKILADSTGN